MKIRLTRKGDAFAISKPDRVEDEQVEEAVHSSAAAAGAGTGTGIDHDMANTEPAAAVKERTPEGDNKRRRLSSPLLDDANGNGDAAPGLEPEASNRGKDVPHAMPPPAEPAKVAPSPDRGKGVPHSGPAPMDLSPARTPAPPGQAPHEPVEPPPAATPAVLPPLKAAAPQAEPLNRELYRIPSYAAWFSWNKIHSLERRALSIFFDGKSASRTPKIYKEYRDFIINKYRENTQRRLTFTEIRRMLIGDVNTLQKVFDFLEHWGLINNQVSADSRKPPAVPIVVEPGPASMRIVQPDVRAQALHPGDAGMVSGSHSSPSLASHKDILGSAGADRAPPKHFCTVCKVDCSKDRYQRQGQAGSVICPSCFKAEKFGATLSAKEFTQITADADGGPAKEEWTQQETLLLLEGVMRHGDNWNRVSEYVGTKTKAECVSHFIRLPFGDRILGDIDTFGDAFQVKSDNLVKPTSPTSNAKAREQKSAKSSDGKAPVQEDLIPTDNMSSQPKADLSEDLVHPLLDASNPLIAQVAFLCSMVGPRVGAAAAQAAVAAITEEEAAMIPFPLLASHSSDALSGQANGNSSKDVGDLDLRRKEDLATQGLHGDKSSVDGQDVTENPGLPGRSLSAVSYRVGITTALAGAAANARLLADQEEREMESTISDLIDTQLKKIQAKLEHFDELELLLEKERTEVERARTQVYADRIRFAEFQFGSSRVPNGEVRPNDGVHSARPSLTPPVPQRAGMSGSAAKLIPTRKL